MAKSLRKVREKLDRRRAAHQATLKSLPSNVNPAAFKMPDSMKRAS